MMTPQTLSIYQVDAFTDVLFSGNPAAVVPLSDWLADDLMQKIAMENNLSETAFLFLVSKMMLISTSAGSRRRSKCRFVVTQHLPVRL